MPLSYLRGAWKRVKALDGVESIKRYFFTSLHCFIVRKTSMNAAAPPDCCVFMTARLVMYYNSTQLNSTVAVGDVPRALCLLCQSTKCAPIRECIRCIISWRECLTNNSSPEHMMNVLCLNRVIEQIVIMYVSCVTFTDVVWRRS